MFGFPQQFPVALPAQQAQPQPVTIQPEADLVDQFIKATQAISSPIPVNASPFQIAQYANAMVRKANTPTDAAILHGYTQTIGKLIERYEAETNTLTQNN